MTTDETDQPQAEEDLCQTLRRLHLSQTVSPDNDPLSPTPASSSLQSPPPALIPGPATLPRSPFLRLPAELRDMTYSLLVVFDSDPPLIENYRESYNLPRMHVLQVNRQVRREAMEILRSRNTWVLLNIHNQVAGRPRIILSQQTRCSQSLYHAPVAAGQQQQFVQGRSIVIDIGRG